MVEEQTSVHICKIFGEEWIENTIDSNPQLRRLVPTLYGIGDLSQILDNRVIEQSQILLDDLKDHARTFVSTSAYQKAIEAVSRERFVILIGPPGAGKSSIAANLCLTGLVEGAYADVLLLASPSQFRTHWDPHSNNRLYWFDDVFGSTSLDLSQISAWQYEWSKLQAAVEAKKAFIVFTSRDYIFKEALSYIKQSAFPILFDSQVVVNVIDLTTQEREQILYNHIKFGNLKLPQKKNLKGFLSSIVIHRNFTPEIARRLGDSMITSRIEWTQGKIDDFVNRSGDYFLELVKTLDDSHQAALVLILLHGNRLSSPIGEAALPDSFKVSYGVTLPKIKKALEDMTGSLVKLEHIRGNVEWTVYHPSMLDALQSLLSDSPEKIELFMLGASFNAILRASTTVETHDHKVFVPMSVWNLLIEKFRKALSNKSGDTANSIAGYLVGEATDELLLHLSRTSKDILNKAVTPHWINLDYGFCYKLARRMSGLKILPSESECDIVAHIKSSALEYGDMHFLDNDDVVSILGELFRDQLVELVIKNDCASLCDVVDGWDDIEEGEVVSFVDSLETLEKYLKATNRFTGKVEEALSEIRIEANLKIPDEQEPPEDMPESEQYSAVQNVASEDIFSDVDE